MKKYSKITHTCVLLILALCAATAFVGCGDDGADDGGASGAAPIISDLTYTMDPLTVGSASVIEGQLNFNDDDGDVELLNIELKFPNGMTQAVAPTPTQNTSGVNAGTVAIALAISVPVAGEYSFDIWVSDSDGNESNKLTGTLTAE